MRYLPRTQSISRKGQITVPKSLCQKYGLQAGDQLVCWVQDGDFYLQPVKRFPPHPRLSILDAIEVAKQLTNRSGKRLDPTLLDPQVLDALSF